ncbi:MAG TPA: hypothetical protein PKD61_05265, partial [Polyangiaceae bacterium]|nr:hypothetical protein [Polyangiaceae bacterium]
LAGTALGQDRRVESIGFCAHFKAPLDHGTLVLKPEPAPSRDCGTGFARDMPPPLPRKSRMIFALGAPNCAPRTTPAGLPGHTTPTSVNTLVNSMS